jgi:outer membrane protein assembly factor BamB
VWRYQLAILDPSAPNEGGNPLDGYGSISSPAFAHGTLYAAGGRTPGSNSSPGSVVAFEPGTGAVKWIHPTPGYVLAALVAVGDVLLVSSNELGNSRSWLDVVDQSNGALLRRFDATAATYGAPSAGRGLFLWTDAEGRAQALRAPKYRP